MRPRREAFLLRVLMLHLLVLCCLENSGVAATFDSTLKTFDAPLTVLADETFTVTVEMLNTGQRAWGIDEIPVWLGVPGTNTDDCAWRDFYRIHPNKKPIQPGESARFEISCRAPDHAGVYPFTWQMVAENVTWFGPLAQRMITVVHSDTEAKAVHQTWRFSSKTWQVEDGLPHNAVQAIAQTEDGYLWIGTQNGLARFDGVRFTVFDRNNTAALKSSYVSALLAEDDGGLWIGTFNGGLVHLRDGKFSILTENDGLVNNSIRSICRSSDGSIWAGTTNGLSRYKSGRFQNFTLEQKLSSRVVRSLATDPRGGVWIGTSAGVDHCSGEAIDRNITPEPLNMRSLYVDKNGDLWGSAIGKLFRYRDGHLFSFTRSEGLSHDIADAVFHDRRGQWWVGTHGGINRLSNGKWISEKNPDGSMLSVVSGILEDTEGNIWVGTQDGLVRFRPKLFETLAQAEGLSHHAITSVTEDPSGALWIGTGGAGVNRLADGVIKVYSRREGLSMDLALALNATAGGLWIGMDFDGGLNFLAGDRVTVFDRQQGLTDATLRVVYSDSAGNVWLGANTGLIQFRENKFIRFTTKEGLPHNTIRVIIEDIDGSLWIGTNDGLSRMRDGRFQNFSTRDGLPDNTVVALYKDADGILWIGTARGLACTRDRKQFSVCTMKDGLFCDEIYEILEDDAERLWISSPKGIFRIEKKELSDFWSRKATHVSSVAYGKEDGLATTQCSGIAKPSGWKTRDGRLWFATIKGLAVVDPRSIREDKRPPAVAIEEILSDKSRVLSLESKVMSTSLTQDSRLRTQDLVLKPGRGELEFHYTALSYSTPEKNRFKYKVEGLDTDWVDAGTRRTAFYNNVPPGSYTFRVIACNKDGIWNDMGAVMSFRLQPHYWQTWWFKALLAAAALSSVGATVRFATRRRMQFKLVRLEHQHAIEKERTRIAQDMHDDLGARLSEILLLSNLSQKAEAKPAETKTQLKRISNATQDLVDNLDAIVWAVNPKNDSFNRFVFYLYEYVPRFLEPTSIRCLFDVPDASLTTPLSSSIRHDLFLVLKEALNNIVKHAGATEVRISLRMENSTLIMTVADNGKGFPADKTSLFGNGLNNMHDRVRKISGSLQLQSEPGKGTSLVLRIPIGNGAV